MQKDAAHESLKREYESRAGLEQLLRSYKDEIVTLKEALQIAAQAVAEATMTASSPVDPNDLAEDAVAGSYPPAAGDEGYQYMFQEDAHSTYPQAEEGVRYWGEEQAAVHPAEMAERWAGEDNAYQVQDAAAVHPAALLELEEEQGIITKKRLLLRLQYIRRSCRQSLSTDRRARGTSLKMPWMNSAESSTYRSILSIRLPPNAALELASPKGIYVLAQLLAQLEEDCKMNARFETVHPLDTTRQRPLGLTLLLRTLLVPSHDVFVQNVAAEDVQSAADREIHLPRQAT